MKQTTHSPNVETFKLPYLKSISFLKAFFKFESCVTVPFELFTCRLTENEGQFASSLFPVITQKTLLSLLLLLLKASFCPFFLLFIVMGFRSPKCLKKSLQDI